MIERAIVADNFLEYQVDQFVRELLNDVPIKEISVEKNPLGERITIYTSTPGLVIGREGSNIKKLTETLKEYFKFENPQIKIGEVENLFLSAKIIARRIANDLARFGSQKFKLTGFRAITDVMNAGAMGVEIRITGKLPAARAKSWLFSKGYLKKTGYVSDFLVDSAIEKVTLKTGVVGIKVHIMLPDTPLPDKIKYIDNVTLGEEVVKKIEEVKTSKIVQENFDEAEENFDSIEEEIKEEKKSPSQKTSVKKSEEKTKVNKDKKTISEVEEE